MTPRITLTPARLARRTLGLASVLLATLVTFAAPVAFDIPAQPAPSALDLFIKQSGQQVAYSITDLSKVNSNAVVGQFEPEAALTKIVENTGFTPRTNGTGKFVIVRDDSGKPGSIEGQVRDESGKPVPGARVSVAGSENGTLTDRRGRFLLEDVPAGAQAVSIFAEGMQKTRVTDVVVRAGHRHTLSAITVPATVAGITQLEDYIVSAKKNDGVIELDPYDVTDRRARPFTERNIDLPRTIDDPRPYYVFDAKTIEISGAANLEGFLKQRLTMNASAVSNAQSTGALPNPMGNTSTINLRGLGADKTLVLVNGRRMAGVTVRTQSEITAQPDLNGIPLTAIDRIEVLPSSASGIYGGNALGGVVNVILKDRYTGGELRLTYDNTFDSDTPRRTAGLSYGLALEGGRTHATVMAQWSDSKALQVKDRQTLFQSQLDSILRTREEQVSVTSPFIGATPNISSPPTLDFPFLVEFGLIKVRNPALTLKNGTVLPIGRTSIAPGTAPNTSFADLSSSLAARAGTYNYNLPNTAQNPSGLKRTLSVEPTNWAIAASIDRKMTDNVGLFVEYSINTNDSRGVYTPLDRFYVIPGSAAHNPFTSNVHVTIPTSEVFPVEVSSRTNSAAAGINVNLPYAWVVRGEYSWSENRLTNSFFEQRGDIVTAFTNGMLNPFVDTLLYPLDLSPYVAKADYFGRTVQRTWTIRASGDLWELPTGSPNLTVGADLGTTYTPEQTRIGRTNLSTGFYTIYYPRTSDVLTGYAELEIPIVPKNTVEMLREAIVQLSARQDNYEVDSGTPFRTVSTTTPPVTSYSTPTRDGLPIFERKTYDATSYSAALRVSPIRGLFLRGSLATAFLPPAPSQLLKNPIPNSSLTTITDTKTSSQYGVRVIQGGNPALEPQNSNSFNAGLVWHLDKWFVKGLRLGADYFLIKQSDAIGSLPVQTIVTFEDQFTDRITRDASGRITDVDASLLNLYRRETEGLDFTADYSVPVATGTISLNAGVSYLMHQKSQFSITAPETESAGFHPSEGGAPKLKSNITAGWSNENWNFTITGSYIDKYRQNGSAGGPSATQRAATGTTPSARAPSIEFTSLQGGDIVTSHTFIDGSLGYNFGHKGSNNRLTNSILRGTSIQVGVRNLFNRKPAFDAHYNYVFYMSPFADLRLRSYWVTLKRQF